MILGSVVIPVLYMMVFLHQGAGGENVRSFTGYINKSAVLQSGADSSWVLSSILWYIYENFTLIAVSQSGEENVDISPLFIGRLALNKSTGDLTIRNVSSRDALKYRVDIVGRSEDQRKTSFVQLSVLEQLGKPSIHLLHNFLDKGSCVISLGCSSTSSNISLSWESEIGFNETFWSGPRKHSGETVLWTSFTPNRVVTFTCISSDGRHKESCQKSVNCTEPEPRGNTGYMQVIHGRSNEKVWVGIIAAVFGGFCGFLGTIIYQKYKDTNRAVWKPCSPSLKQQVPHSSSSLSETIPQSVETVN